MQAAALSTIGTIVSTVGSVVGMVGQMQAASYQAAVAGRNAQIMEENARREVDRGQVEAQDYAEEARAQLGSLIAAQASSGLDLGTGSGAQRRRGLTNLARRDQYRIRHDSELSATRMRQQASDLRVEASSARRAGRFAMLGGLLNVGSTLIGGARTTRRLRARE